MRHDDDVLQAIDIVVLNFTLRVLDARNQRRQHLVVFLREKRFRDDDRFHVDLLDTYIQFW